MGDGDSITSSSAMIVRGSGSGCGAAEVSLGSTGITSTTREPEAEGLDGVAGAPKDREPRLLAGGAADEVGAIEVFFAFLSFFFFVPATAVGAGGGEGAAGEAGGEGSERSDEGADPNRAPEKDDVEWSDILSEKRRALRSDTPEPQTEKLNDYGFEKLTDMERMSAGERR